MALSHYATEENKSQQNTQTATPYAKEICTCQVVWENPLHVTVAEFCQTDKNYNSNII